MTFYSYCLQTQLQSKKQRWNIMTFPLMILSEPRRWHSLPEIFKTSKKSWNHGKPIISRALQETDSVRRSRSRCASSHRIDKSICNVYPNFSIMYSEKGYVSGLHYKAEFITKTYLYNLDPLKPHFYTVKLGLTGVCIIFLISAQKHRL